MPESADTLGSFDSANSFWSEADEGESPADSGVLLLFTAEVARNASEPDPPTSR